MEWWKSAREAACDLLLRSDDLERLARDARAAEIVERAAGAFTRTAEPAVLLDCPHARYEL